MHSNHLRCLAFFSMVAVAACGDNASTAGTGGAGGSGASTTSSTTSSSSVSTGGGGAGGAPIDYDTALLGTWKSKGCEPSGTMNSRLRTYVFTPSDVKITYELFAGAACEAGPKVLTVTIHGDAEFPEPSPVAPGATDVIFTFKSRAITPTAAGVGFLGGACGQYPWAADVEVDVTKDGCGELVPSAAACAAEYDLAAFVGDVVYFGDRSAPLCSKETRPTKLAEWGVVKQP
jgi:hypothetical protein